MTTEQMLKDMVARTVAGNGGYAESTGRLRAYLGMALDILDEADLPDSLRKRKETILRLIAE
jgi:hypothetical protein